MSPSSGQKPGVSQIVFLLGFSTLLAHELDAVARAEWRVLPITSFLPDPIGYPVFVLAHIPLVAWLVWLIGHADARIRQRTQWAISAFLIVHVVLHLAFSAHEHYDFHSALSRGLIFGGGALGAAHLALSWRRRGEPGR